MDVHPPLVGWLGSCAGAALGFPVPSQNGGELKELCGPKPMAVGTPNIKPPAVGRLMYGTTIPTAVGAFSNVQWYYLLLIVFSSIYCMQDF